MMDGKYAIQNAVLMNMRMMNMINGETDMEWITSNGEYKFIFKRFNNKLWNDESGESNYIITLEVYNMSGVILNGVGTLIDAFRFNELDALRILDCLSTFGENLNGGAGVGDSFTITINSSVAVNCLVPYIFIQVLQFEDSLMINDELHDILFQIKQFNNNTLIDQNRDLTRISTLISMSDLEQLCFTLYFSCLIDIDLPLQYAQSMEHLTSMFI